jgi:hypothetical protein
MYNTKAQRKMLADLLQEVLERELIRPVMAAFKPAADRVKVKKAARPAKAKSKLTRNA